MANEKSADKEPDMPLPGSNGALTMSHCTVEQSKLADSQRKAANPEDDLPEFVPSI
jgi:hypothetical protein